ncbi:unconventional myosin-IXb-like isoform X2 [Oscarella lobularis]|uniref:unconventional myosin-IXb-like isoform X2 n=1 Tax=Oscarella lobularis TaxID=121494 RepID=UPI00331443FB
MTELTRRPTAPSRSDFDRKMPVASDENGLHGLDVDDMCALVDLTESTMLENLSNRFARDEIYTYVGSVLIAVNPFRLIPLYQPKHFDLYRGGGGGNKVAVSPHIFAIADAAYTSMLKEKRNQCVIVSGESGSGKTESTKYMLRYLMAVSNKLKHGGVEQKIIASGFVLEAFGNATTVSNNNSSRFGKFLSLKFREDGAFIGASIEKYLLEKSRIVYQAPRERNYHVFYYLLAGADDVLRRKLWLKNPEYFHFLNQGGLHLSEEKEQANFTVLIQSMEKVGFSSEIQKWIFTVLAAVLHLGNILFESKADLAYSEGVDVKNVAQLKVVSDLLQVKFETLYAALTVRRNRTRGETVLIPYSKDEAVAARDAMAKSLYGSLFNWIVEQSNKGLIGRLGRSAHTGRFIGLLDIFGFEVFPVNSFEQFCINYANEQLQFYFNQHIFRLEQEEYASEGIRWTSIEYLDNRACLDLIARKPNGLMQLLDDECRLASATDYTLFDKFNKEHRDHLHYYEPQIKKKDPVFGIRHYAGSVEYHLLGFREKNSDLVRPDIVAVLKGSVMLFLRQIIKSDPVVVRRWNLLRCVAYFCGTLLCVVKRKNSKEDEQKQKQHGDKPLASGGDKRTVNAKLGVGDGGKIGSPKRRDKLSVQEKIKSLDSSFNDSPPPSRAGGLKKALSEDRKRVLSKGALSRQSSKAARFSKKHRMSKIKLLKEADEAKSRNRGGFLIGGVTGARLSTRRQATVGAQFTTSLSALMDTLLQARPYFIRCIKSNEFLVPRSFDREMVLRQLRYTGMLDTVKIRKSGYSVRYTFEEFRRLYSPLLRSSPSIQRFLSDMKLDSNQYQIGRTKVFMRSRLHAQLQASLNNRLARYIVVIQRWTRMCLQRLRYLRVKRAIVVIQSWYRGHSTRKMFYAEKERFAAALAIQSAWRRHRSRKRYVSLKRAAVVLQRSWRVKSARERELRKVQLEKDLEAGVNVNINKNDEKGLFSAPRLRRSTGVRLQQTTKSSDLNRTSASFSGQLPRTHTRVRKMAEAYRKRIEEKKAASASQPSTQERLSSVVKERKVTQALAGSQWQGRGSTDEEHSSSSRSPKSEPKQSGSSRTPSSVSESPAPSGGGGERAVSPVERSRTAPPPGSSPKPKPLALRLNEAVVLRRKVNVPTVSIIRQSDDSETPVHFVVTSPPPGLSVHSLKPTTFIRLTRCSVCSKILAGLIKQGFKCSACHLAFHRHCVDHRAPCRGSGAKSSSYVGSPPAAQVIRNSRDLEDAERFFSAKIAVLQEQSEQSGKRDNVIDVIFKSALKEFHKNLLSLSAVKGDNFVFVSVTYSVLHNMFSDVLQKVLDVKQIAATFPVTMAVNAFKSSLDEFVATRVPTSELESPFGQKKQKKRTKMNKKEKKKLEYFKHKFKEENCNVQTVCEVCDELIRLLDRGYVCQFCKVICHENCVSRISTKCVRNQKSAPFDGKGKQTIGELVAQPGSRTPVALESCLHFIEIKGLYTEGIYRRSGSSVEIRKLLKELTKNVSAVVWDNFSVYCVAAVVKQFLRDLPEPLVTFRAYPEFLQATEIGDAQERYDALCALASQLPKANRNTLERVVFHLARVSQQEKTNKMTTYNLAVIFSQCLMRPPEGTSPLDSLADLPKQRLCVESLIDGQKAKIKAVLSNVDYLDAESYTRSRYLSTISTEIERSSMYLAEGRQQDTDSVLPVVTYDIEELDSEQRIVEQELEELENQRAAVTESISLLTPSPSHEEEPMSPTSVKESDVAFGDVLSSEDELESDEYALTFDLPAVPSKLRHINLSRARHSKRRSPSRKFRLERLSNTQ